MKPEGRTRDRPRPSHSSLVLGSQTNFRGRERRTSTRTEKVAAFTYVEMLVAAAVIGVLVLFAIPLMPHYVGPGMTRALSNARQLHLATQTMALDTSNAGGPGLEWTTSTDARGRNVGIATVGQYFDALVKGGYLTENDLRKLVTAPGIGPSGAAPSAANSCFKFFAVENSSPADQQFLVTANWENRRLTSGAPFGTQGFVAMTKGGRGGIYTGWSDARSTSVFPVGKDAAGHAYSDEVLK